MSSGVIPLEVSFSPQPIADYTDFPAWIAKVKSRVAGRIFANLDRDTDQLDRVIECAEVATLPGTFVACAFYQRDLNEALTRLGLFMGAGVGLAAGTVVPHDDFTLKNYKKVVAGHNLPGPTLTAFNDRLKEERDPRLGLSPAEAAFLEVMLAHPRVRERHGRFYLIGVSVQSMKPQESVFSHEIFHAYYSLSAGYRAVVDMFWRDRIGDGDRARITAEVAKGYNVDDESLVVDEFQAYLLQENAPRDRMRMFVAPYRAALVDALRAAGQLPEFVRD